MATKRVTATKAPRPAARSILGKSLDGLSSLALSFFAKATEGKVLVLLFAFFASVYSLTTALNLKGYESETFAAASQFIQTGHVEISFRAGIFPFFLTSIWLALGKWLGASGYNYWQYFFYPVVSSLIPVTFYLIGRKYYSMRRSALIALLVGLATMIWPYSKIGMEPLLVLSLLLLVLGIIRDNKPPRVEARGILGNTLDGFFSWASSSFAKASEGQVPRFESLGIRRRENNWLVAISSSLTIWSKSYGIIFVAVALMVLVIADRKKYSFDQEMWKFVALGGLVGLLGYGLFNMWLGFPPYHSAYGGIGLGVPGWGLISPIVGIYGYLLSTGKSIFLYSPLLLLAFFYWRKFSKRSPLLHLLLTLWTSASLLFLGSFWYWSDETWGPRYLLPVTTLAMLMLGEVNLRKPHIKPILVSLSLIGFLIQLMAVAFHYVEGMWILVRWNVFYTQYYQFIPDLSPLYLQVRLTLALLFGHSINWFNNLSFSFYNTLQGAKQISTDSINLQEYAKPDLWWYQSYVSGALGWKSLVVIAILSIVALWSAFGLTVLLWRLRPLGNGLGSSCEEERLKA